MIDDLDDDDCEGMEEFVYLSPAELIAAQSELNRLRREMLKQLDGLA